MYPTPAHLDSCVGGSGVILCLRRNDGVGVTSFIYHFDLAQVPERLHKLEDSFEVFFSQLAQLPRRQLYAVGSEARILIPLPYDPGDVHPIHLSQRGKLLGGYSSASCLDL